MKDFDFQGTGEDNLTQFLYEQLENVQMSEDEVLDFLIEPSHFRQLSHVLKELCVKAKIPRITLDLFHKSYEGIHCDSLQEFHHRVKKKVPPLIPLEWTSSEKDFAGTLQALLTKQEEECSCRKRETTWRGSRGSIQRWFQEQTGNGKGPIHFHRIESREDAIAVCFALDLSYQEACDFLNKTSHMVFNLRNAYDAIYIYCLKRHRPLSCARELMDIFDRGKNGEPEPFRGLEAGEATNEAPKLCRQVESRFRLAPMEISPISPPPGQTTLFFNNQLGEEAGWDSDEQFLTTFLLPNKARFLSYSKTALREYRKLKISTSLYSMQLLDEDPGARNLLFKKILSLNPEYRDHCPLLDCALRRAGKNDFRYKKLVSSLEESFQSFLTKGYDLSDPLSLEAYDASLSSLSAYLSAVLPVEQMMASYLPSLFLYSGRVGTFVRLGGKDHLITPQEEERGAFEGCETFQKETRFRPKSKLLEKNVLYLFFNGDFYRHIDTNPEGYIHNLGLRKAIILLFFFQYSVEFGRFQRGEISSGHENDSLGDFMDKLNRLLIQCQMGVLYPANHFDYLILRSIRQQETGDVESQSDSDMEEESSLVPFFQRVIALSYEREEEKKRLKKEKSIKI